MRNPIEFTQDLMLTSTITRPVIDPFQSLKEDHRRVDEMLQKVCETTPDLTGMRKELFAGIKQGLTEHTEIEETSLYPRLEKIDDTHTLTMEAYEEHDVVKTLLEEIDSLECDTDEWMAKITVVKENVEHHVKEEETKLFPDANDKLNEEEKERMASEIEEYLQGSKNE
jgi:hemerythrin superfamily protein